MAQERMADEEVQVEGLFLSRDNAAQETLIAQHDADDLGRQRCHLDPLRRQSHRRCLHPSPQVCHFRVCDIFH
jgi:hypothetical protein